MLRYKHSNNSLKNIMRKKIIYKILTKFLSSIAIISIFIYCLLDYAEFNYSTVKYLLLYSSALTQILCLALTFI